MKSILDSNKVDMLDNLQIILWSVVYLEIVFWGIKYHKERLVLMPLLAGSLNFAWEMNALVISRAFWGHVVWLALDILIIVLNLYNIRKARNRALYCLMTVAFTVVLKYVFMIPNADGMLISVFAIDLIMAIDYILNAKKVSEHGRIPIAITKLLGDLFAWLAYARSAYVNVIGVMVFLLNLYYVSMCLEMHGKVYKSKKR